LVYVFLQKQSLSLGKALSFLRKYKIMVYPTGTIKIMIKTSKQPFMWYDRDNRLTHCLLWRYPPGLKRQIVSFRTPNPHPYPTGKPLIEIGYDIPLSNLKDRFRLTYFNGSLQVKHLDIVFQVYSKLLSDKGRYLHIENQQHFPSNYPDPILFSLLDTIVSRSPQEILDTVIPFNLIL